MARNRQPNLAVFGSILLQKIERGLIARLGSRRVDARFVPNRHSGAPLSDAYYIGLGDPFDDDRRRVRSQLYGRKTAPVSYKVTYQSAGSVIATDE